MKLILLAGLVLLCWGGISGCKNEGPSVFESLDTTGKQIVTAGSFVNGAHRVSDLVRVLRNDSTQVLQLEDFATDNGPALRVYLSRNTSNSDFVDLGELKGTRGTFSYPFAQSVDTRQYSTVLIWCQRYAVLFGYRSE